MADEITEKMYEFEKPAATDGAYAIAYALLALAHAQGRTARAIDALGTGKEEADGDGAILGLTRQIKESMGDMNDVLTGISNDLPSFRNPTAN